MAEVFGVISGVVGVLDVLKTTVDSIKTRTMLYMAQSASLTAAAEAIESVQALLQKICERLKGDAAPQNEEVKKSIQHTMEATSKMLKEATGAVVEVEKLTKRAFKSFVRAKKIDGIMRKIETTATKAEDFIVQSLQPRLDFVSELRSAIAARGLSSQGPSFVKRIIALDVPIHAVFDFSYEGRSTDELSCEALLKRSVLEEGTGSANSVTAVTGVSGMGGIGKTLALLGLAHDADIANRFVDGVYYERFGKDATESSVVSAFALFVRRTGGSSQAAAVERCDTIEAATTAGEWFHGRNALFLIDDLWASRTVADGYVGAFRQFLRAVGPGQSRMVITTRDMKVALKAARRPLRFERRASLGPQAEQILLARVNYAATLLRCSELDPDEHRNALNRLLRRCDGVPLTLSVVGSGLARMRLESASWADAMERYDEELNATGNHVHQAPEDSYPQSLEQAIRTSLGMAGDFDGQSANATGGTTRRPGITTLFSRLCVMEKQALINDDVLHHIWPELEARAVVSLKTRLLSLALLECEERDGMTMVRAHDHVIEFCEMELRFQQTFVTTHRAFLNSYLPQPDENATLTSLAEVPADIEHSQLLELLETHTRHWWNLPQTDSRDVLIENVVRLLRRANMDVELLGLVSCAQWTRERLDVSGVRALLDDFEACPCVTDDFFGTEKPLAIVRDLVSDIAQFLLADALILASEAHTRLAALAQTQVLVKRYLKTAGSQCEWLEAERPSEYYREPAGPAYIEFEAGMKASSIWMDWNNMKAFVAKKRVLYEISLSSRELLSRTGLPDYCDMIVGDGTNVLLRSSRDEDGDGKFILWDRLEEVEKWKSPTSTTSALAVSQDGSTIAACVTEENQTELVFVDVNSGATACHRVGDERETLVVSEMSLNHDGSVVLLGTYQGYAQLRSRHNGENISRHQVALPASARCVFISEAAIASIGDDWKIRLWHIDQRSRNLTLKREVTHSKHVMKLTGTPDGHSLAIAEEVDEDLVSVRVMETTSGRQRFATKPEYKLVDMQLSPDGRHLATVNSEGLVKLYDTNATSEVSRQVPLPTPHNMSSVAFNSDGSTASHVSISYNDRMVIFVSENGSKQVPWSGPDPPSDKMSASGRYVVLADSRGHLLLWDMDEGRACFEKCSFKSPDCAVSAGGERVVVVSFNDDCEVYDGKGNKISSCRIPGDIPVGFHCVAVSDDGGEILVSRGRSVMKFEDDMRTLVWERELPWEVGCMVLASDGSKYATSSSAGTLVVGETQTGEVLAESEHNQVGNDATIKLSADGSTIVSVDPHAWLEHKLSVWRLGRTGAQGSSGSADDGGRTMELIRTCSITLPLIPSGVDHAKGEGEGAVERIVVSGRVAEPLFFRVSGVRG